MSNNSKLPIIELFDTPGAGVTEWRYPSVFKIDAKGAEREWYAAFIDGHIVTFHGQFGGVMTQSEPNEVEINNSGRDIISQAILQLQARYELKRRKDGYRFSNEDSSGTDYKPMLSYDWNKRPKSFKLYYPVAVQPKLDGIRCITSYDQYEGIIFRSRSKLAYDFNDIFGEELSFLFAAAPFPIILDGELYIHGMKLQKLASLVNTRNVTEKELKSMPLKKRERALEIIDMRKELLTYNIFTISTPMDMVTEERNKILTMTYKKAQANYGKLFTKIKLVDTYIARSEESIFEYLEYFIQNGYEGAMIYKLGCSLPDDKKNNAYYKNSRTWNIIKLKEFFDEEGIVVDVTDGKGSDKGKAMVHIKDKFGVIHIMTPSADDALRIEWFDDPSLILGKEATIKHYGRTLDGKLRHANMISIRDYE